MEKINRRNRKRFTAASLGVNCECIPVEVSLVLKEDKEQLDYCSRLYDRLKGFRKQSKRNKDFYYGRQLRDKVVDPDTGFDITEEDMLRKNGYPTIVSNLIYKIVRTMTSQYTSGAGDPYCVARDREEQKVSDMLSAALQYVYQCKNLQIVNSKSYTEFCLNGMVGWRVGYNWDNNKMNKEVYAKPIDTSKLFIDDNTDGLYMENLTTIGLLHDWDLVDVEDLCAGNQLLVDYVREQCKVDKLNATRQFFEENDRTDKDFYTAKEGKCRVIEVWYQRAEETVRCWDTMTGKIRIFPRSQAYRIEEENNMRRAQMAELGGLPEEAAICTKIEPFIYRRWVCRYFLPNGVIIKEIENPYDHNSHPFVLGAHPIIDGEIHSLVEVSIPTQKAINRILQRIEFMRMASAKGVLIIPEQLLEGKDINQIAKTWAKSNGVIALKWKEGIPMPQQVVGSSVNSGDMEMVQMQMSLLEDITGVHRAMQGKEAQSGTPASLYAMELQNAQASTSDVQKWYTGLIRERDLKIVQVIQQFYDHGKYSNLVGRGFDEEAKRYNPDLCRNVLVDVNIVEGSSSMMYRNSNEQLLMELLKSGGIDLEMYLQNSSVPFADKLLDAMKKKQQELQQQQEQMQAQGMQQNPLISQAMAQQPQQ